MRKVKAKEFIVLFLPVLALAGLALYRPKSTPTLVFSKVYVGPIPLKQRNRANPFYPDTRITIEIGYRKPFFLNRLWEKRSILLKPNSSYLTDARGRKYSYLKDYNGSSSYVGNVKGGHGNEEQISYIHEVHLAQIPPSAGKITFHSTYYADDGFTLPVSAVLRR
jgi:hypothetical protein